MKEEALVLIMIAITIKSFILFKLGIWVISFGHPDIVYHSGLP